MKNTFARTLLAFLVASASTPALASSFAGTTAGSSAEGSSETASSSSGEDKVVRLARDDAALFVASEGRIRGAQLEAALLLLRERHAELRGTSDLQLAQAILAR